MSSLTIEQVAAQAELPTSTIRMYQTRGLLHPPRRSGRSARYDESHLDRLALIQRLQNRGFSLPAIAELIAAREKGASVADVLGISAEIGDRDDWVALRLRDVRALVPLRDARPMLLRRATRLGLIRWRRGRPETRRWALAAGLKLGALAVPSGEALDEFDALRDRTDRIAEQFVMLFERRLWTQTEGKPDQLDQIRTLLLELTETAEEVVVGSLRESIRKSAEDFARRHELLPVSGPPPEWLENPKSVKDTIEDADIERFLDTDEVP